MLKSQTVIDKGGAYCNRIYLSLEGYKVLVDEGNEFGGEGGYEGIKETKEAIENICNCANILP